jgi:methionyl-tRNA formyltransferase
VRVLFWGTPEFAVPALDALLRSPHEVVGVVTRPDRPRGRSGRPQPAAVKRHLLLSGRALPIFQPPKPTGGELREQLAALEPDVSVVAAYGNLLPGSFLALPPLGSLNLHASLLPRHRGAAPVSAAILAGDAVTGITLMRMDRGLDTGPILLQRPLAIKPSDSCGRLTSRLARVAAEVVLEGLAEMEAGRLWPRPQNEEEATHAPRIRPEDAHIRWSDAAEAIERMLRAYDPWPGAFTSWEGQRLKLFRGRVAREGAPDGVTSVIFPAGSVVRGTGAMGAPGKDAPAVPGEVLPGPELFVSTGEGTLEILELQLEGRPRMAAAEFLKGRRIAPGSRFE